MYIWNPVANRLRMHILLDTPRIFILCYLILPENMNFNKNKNIYVIHIILSDHSVIKLYMTALHPAMALPP